MNMVYPIQLKKAVLQKVLQENRPHHEVAAEYGVGRSTIGNWLMQYKKNGNISSESKEKRPGDWSSEERMSALLETGAMTPEDRAVWCRQKGLFALHLEQWKKEAISGMSITHGQQRVKKESYYKKEISSLKKDLSRKEKALAETAALLVLQKKVQEIWGEREDG